MRRNLLMAATGVLLSTFCLVQSAQLQNRNSEGADTAELAKEQTGAKALYINSLTNQQMISKSNDQASTSRAVPAVTGVLYYVELLRSNGELMRVNSDRIFHTGDHIRLHLNSNVNGSLVIYQSEDGSKPERLFPSGKLSGQVTKGADVVLPSNRAWFVFDEHPGQIQLTLQLTADAAKDARSSVVSADAVRDLHQSQAGSKALKIEKDDSPTDPSRVVIVDSRQDSKIPPGQIAVEVTLEHRS